MMSPITATTNMTLPSGIKRALTMSRTATLVDPGNPFTLTSLNDTVIDNGRVSTSVYDAVARRFTNMSAGGRVTRVDTDVLGRAIRTQLGTLAPVTYSYVSGQLRTLTRGTTAPRMTTLAYNAARLQTAVTDPIGRVFGTTYDAAERVTAKTLADGRVARLAYDANGNTASVMPPGRNAHAFAFSAVDLQTQYDPPNIGAVTADQVNTTYDTDRQWSRTVFPDNRSASATYDNAGRLSVIAFSRGNLSIAYSPGTGLPNSLGAPSSINLTSTFDGTFLGSQSTSGPIPTVLNWTYDNNLRLATESVNGGSTVNFTYDFDGLPTGVGAMVATYHRPTGC